MYQYASISSEEKSLHDRIDLPDAVDLNETDFLPIFGCSTTDSQQEEESSSERYEASVETVGAVDRDLWRMLEVEAPILRVHIVKVRTGERKGACETNHSKFDSPDTYRGRREHVQVIFGTFIQPEVYILLWGGVMNTSVAI